MPSRNSTANRRGASKLIAVASDHSSSDPFKARYRAPPALLIRMSRSPTDCSTCSRMRAAAAADVRSSAIRTGRSSPAFSNSSATDSRSDFDRAKIATRQPSPASITAVAFPIPLVPPVTRQVWSASCRSTSNTPFRIPRLIPNLAKCLLPIVRRSSPLNDRAGTLYWWVHPSMAAVQKIVNTSVEDTSVTLRVTPPAGTGYVAGPNDLHGAIDIDSSELHANACVGQPPG